MAFENYYLHTLFPAESFFQTVLMNTPFHSVIVNDDKRAIIDINALNINDVASVFEKYLKSNNHLFIRKLNYTNHQDLLKYIDENFHSALPEINDVNKELRNNLGQNN